MCFSRISVGLLVMFCVCFAFAQDIQPYKIFSSNMVLQRSKPIRISGTAPSGTEVTVRFADKTAKGNTSAEGEWGVEFPAMEAGGPYEVKIEGKGTPVTFTNVMVGEVWFCSGQSNMEWRVRNVLNAEKEMAAANYPNLRLYQGSNYQTAAVPQKNLAASWTVCTPETVAGFSAVAYFFGLELLKDLKVPVGLVHVSWGGTRIEPWIAPSGFSAVPALKPIHETVQARIVGTPENKRLTDDIISGTESWLAKAKKDRADGKLIESSPDFPAALKVPGDIKQSRGYPAFLYNSMIAPLLPYTFRGFLWYQGCANVTDGAIYKDKMQALILSLRREFRNQTLPIYFSQLAPYTYGGSPYSLPVTWEAQQAFADSDPNAHMAVINDIGNPKDIHPRNKQDVGKRLALLALKYEYGRNIVADSPSFESYKVDGSRMIVTFRNAKQLKTRDGKAPSHFEIAGGDGAFFPANAEISGNQVILTSDSVAVPHLVRFAWNQVAEPNLRNEADLQAGAFRAGTLPVRGMLDTEVPEAKNFRILYAFNPLIPVKNGRAEYLVDKTAELRSFVPEEVAYFVYLTYPDGKKQFVFVSMDAFSKKFPELGVPTVETGTPFQVYVNHLFVKSNVPGVKNGKFEKGNIEFWKDNYSPENAMKVPGARGDVFDFGDQRAASGNYGSMQVHNPLEKQTVFALNNFNSAVCDIGIGNAPGANTDWTFSGTGKHLAGAVILILVR